MREISIHSSLINELYKNNKLNINSETRQFDKRYSFNEQNEPILITANDGTNQSALATVKDELFIPVSREVIASGIRPRNKEQTILMSLLLDDNVKVIVISGKSGTGKTIAALACAMQKIEDKKYTNILLIKPMSQVGRYNIGILPGELSDKVGPYLTNYYCNIETILGKRKSCIEDAMQQYNMDFIPLQLVRGASWSDTFILADEVQVLDDHEMVTLGTRVAEGSKLIIMGDLNQRDEKIARDKTGMHKLINSEIFKTSKITAHINLTICERGPIPALFADIFEANK